MLGIPLRPKTARKVNLFFRILIGLAAAWVIFLHVGWYECMRAARCPRHPALEDYLFFGSALYALLACVRGRWNPFRI